MSDEEFDEDGNKHDEEEEKKHEEEEEQKKEEEEEVEGIVLDEANLATRISLLGSPNDLEFAYTKLLMNESEVKDASILQNYAHLRFLSLAGNALRKADWLAAMTEAVYIDLHGNSIKALPEFPAPIPNLINISLQGNKIRGIPVLPFPILTKLDLSENAVRTIAPSAFAQIERLKLLKLSTNRLRKIEADTFKGLKRLKRLYLDGNEISKIDPEAFQDLECLIHLDLSGNQVASLIPFQGKMPKLVTLVIPENQIPKTSELKLLKESAALRQITTTGNPLCSEDEYRMVIIHTLPQCTKVDDDEEVTQEDREGAAEIVREKEAEAARIKAEEEEEERERKRRRAEEEEEERRERRARAAEEEEGENEDEKEQEEPEEDL
jgi:hypothetical protein